MAKEFGLNERKEWIERKIYGTGAEGKVYWMGDLGRAPAFQNILENGENAQKNVEEKISIINIYNNYIYIDKYLRGKLTTSHKFEAFLLYFLKCIILIEISIDDSDDVSMVFEVINDRGEKLLPYEVFKGEMLGQLEKEDVEIYHTIWNEHVYKLHQLGDNEVDEFFRYYFRSKNVDTMGEHKEFDGSYNKTIFSKKWDLKFKLKRNPINVKKFLKEDFNYFANIYTHIRKEAEIEAENPLFYNHLNEQERQYLLILSCLVRNDDLEDIKIKLLAQMFDRNYTLLQLYGCYDSNSFGERTIELNKQIRNRNNLDEIKLSFNTALMAEIENKRNIPLDDIFNWKLFYDANVNVLSTRFTRYFFARIDKYLSKQIKHPSDTYHNFVRNTGHVNGYHIEHILARDDNGQNLALFNNDEDLFYRERARLGSVLLLKGRDNISSNNEPYPEKLKTYAHSTIWAQTLTENFYHSNVDFKNFFQSLGLDFQPINNFDRNSIEQRQKLLFELVRIIWGNDNK